MRNERHDQGSTRKWDAICVACSSATQVPFEPEPGRDVFCLDCLRKRPRKPSR